MNGCGRERPKVRVHPPSDREMPYSRHWNPLTVYTILRRRSCEPCKFHNWHLLGVQSNVTVSQSFYSEHSLLREEERRITLQRHGGGEGHRSPHGVHGIMWSRRYGHLQHVDRSLSDMSDLERGDTAQDSLLERVIRKSGVPRRFSWCTLAFGGVSIVKSTRLELW